MPHQYHETPRRAGPVGWLMLPMVVAFALWTTTAMARPPAGRTTFHRIVDSELVGRGQDEAAPVFPENPGIAPLEEPDEEQKFPTVDEPPPQVPVGGAWSFIDPKFIGPDGTPGFGPWTRTFFTARRLPGYKADIKEPGPDSANFPNSAFTLPPGEVYIETSPITYQKNPFFNRRRVDERVNQYSLPTLLRVGLFRDFELRFWSQTLQIEQLEGRRTIGFGPLMFDSKFHFWDQDKEKHIPAFGVQIMAQSNLGSQVYAIPQWEPGFSLNFDYEFENGVSLEWNIDGEYTIDNDGKRVYQAGFLWAVQRELLPNLDGFIHGYLNTPESTRFQEGSVVGVGMIWFATKQMALDGSYSVGIRPGSPSPIIRFGLSLAL